MSTRPPALIIAEAGVNHNGSLELALELVDAAINAGADVIKFQSFNAASLVADNASMAAYQRNNTGMDSSQLEMLKALEMPAKDMAYIKTQCDSNGIEFLSTAFDLKSLNMLMKMGCRRIKIASGELTNKPFLDACAGQGLPVILSTGMADLSEVSWAVETLFKGGLKRDHLSILHCTTNYPAAPHELNLLAIHTLAERFDTAVGYSDHSLGADASLAAVSLGAKVIEKHLTLDPAMQGPDHAASMSPDDFTDLVRRIRRLEQSLGDGVKAPQPVEMQYLDLVRKSVIASRSILKGEIFSTENITTKRPGIGISAMHYDIVLGKQANRDYANNEMIDASCLK